MECEYVPGIKYGQKTGVYEGRGFFLPRTGVNATPAMPLSTYMQ